MGYGFARMTMHTTQVRTLQNFMVIRLPFTVISHQKCVKQHFMMIYFLAIMTQGQFLLFLPIHFHSLHTHCGLEDVIILEKNTYADVWLCRWFVIVKNFSARCHSAYFITLKKYLHPPTIFSSTYTKVRFREFLNLTGLFLLFLGMALALGRGMAKQAVIEFSYYILVGIPLVSYISLYYIDVIIN